MLRPVEDVCLGRSCVVVADERLFHHVLDLFHVGEALLVQLGAHLARQEQQIRGTHLLPFHRTIGARNGIEDLTESKGATVPSRLTMLTGMTFLMVMGGFKTGRTSRRS